MDVRHCVHTGSAAQYGIISFDAQNAEALWLTPNRSLCSAEEALVEQARRVKAASPSTKALVYRNVMWALQWLSSERAAMEDPAKAHYFLRYPVPTPGAAARNIYYTQAHEGNQYMWNYSNPEAVKYKVDVVVFGQNGIGSPYVDGMFFDDPGPSTAEHPMPEYITNIQAAAKAVGMTAPEVQTLATDMYVPTSTSTSTPMIATSPWQPPAAARSATPRRFRCAAGCALLAAPGTSMCRAGPRALPLHPRCCALGVACCCSPGLVP